MKTWQDGEDRFLAFQNLLVEHVIGFIERYKSWRAEDYHYRINIVKTVLTIVDGDA